MITFKLDGFGFYEAASGNIDFVRPAQIRWQATDPGATATYRNVGGGDGLPHSRLDAPDIREIVETIAGHDPDPDNRADSHDSILEVNHRGGTAYVSVVDYMFDDGDDDTDNDTLSLVFQLGGAELPQIDSPADLRTYMAGIQSMGPVQGGRFEPGDTLRFRAIADDIVGDKGGNRLVANAKDNLLIGRGGDDTLRGLGGRDVVRGQTGDDTLAGGGGDDRLLGGGGDDALAGGRGSDRLIGGGGDDRLEGGGGNDRLEGGAGADLFVFTARGGRDEVADLDFDEHDLVRLRGTEGADLSDLAEMRGDDLVVAYGRTSITFEDVGSLAAVEDAFLLV